MLFGAAITVVILDIPDVPPIEDSQYVDTLGEIDEEETVKLGPGWETSGEATFAVISVVIEDGTLSMGIGHLIQTVKIVQTMLMFTKK